MSRVVSNRTVFCARVHTPELVEEFPVEDDIEERWRELCEQAAVEQNPRTLIELVSEINRMLDNWAAHLNERMGGE